jgi:hypothetical protein
LVRGGLPIFLTQTMTLYVRCDTESLRNTIGDDPPDT